VNTRLRGWLLVGLQFGLLVALAGVSRGDLWTVGPSLRTAGLVLRLVGAALVIAGVRRLGRGATVHPQPGTAAQLQTEGVYRYVRHPIYSGVLLFGVAIVLTSGSVIHVLLWVALVGVLMIKSRFEEELLCQAFPDYPTYAQRTGRLFPKLR
jgi:protein-S-isoprenylcysteine O-methyltransferase Ste14